MTSQAAQYGKILGGRFRLLGELGSGSFGTVYEATQLVLGQPFRPVALKVLNQLPEGIALEDRFKDIVTLGRILENIGNLAIRRHFVEVYDLFVEPGPPERPVVVMELVRGTTLQKKIRRGSDKEPCCGLPVETVLHYMLPACRALEFMHTHEPGNPVLHLDLKPDNILVTQDDSVKIADFGLASDALSLLRTTPRGGAQAYLPPELLQAPQNPELYTPRVDVYAIGLMLYEMLVGELPRVQVARKAATRTPHAPDTYSEALIAASRTIPRPDRLPMGVLLAEEPNCMLVDIVMQCLTYEPHARFSDAGALRQALEDFQRGIASAPEVTDTVRWQTRLREGQYHHRRKQHEKAEAAYREVVLRAPRTAAGYLQLAELLLETSRVLQAVDVLKEGLKNVTNDVQLHLMMAKAFDQLGQKSMADSYRQKARNLASSGGRLPGA